MAQPALNPAPRTRTEELELERAVRRTLSYFALFSYVPSPGETHRYLHGMQAGPEQVRRVLSRQATGQPLEAGHKAGHGGRYAGLSYGKGDSNVRRSPHYGWLLGYLPFVRMIGLTGSRAMNGSSTDDIDLMVVSAPGRVWLCRLGVVAAVRLAQMIPLYGGATYRALWTLNPAVSEYLPNADPFPDPPDRPLPVLSLIKRLGERLLAGRAGDHLERWERTRKVARLRGQGITSTEISLTADQCKGHFDGHRARVLDAYGRRRAEFEGA
jgi:hypothetical protein